jgi:protein-S-isoprenylcysteine O-methyltransferase Ste14
MVSRGDMPSLYFRAFRSSVLGALIVGALLFLTAGTLKYWQAWVFMAVFMSASIVITVYLAIRDPKLLERRMRAGPTAEREKTQKVIMFFAMLGFIGLLVLPAFDRRFGWSAVPPYACLIGDWLVAISFVFVFRVLKVNSYSASTIQVAEHQKVVSTGPYALIRHPMYAGSLPMVVGTPLALGSWWGLGALILFIPALLWRLLDEEKYLKKNLPGYTEYTRKVQYRLVPRLW